MSGTAGLVVGALVGVLCGLLLQALRAAVTLERKLRQRPHTNRPPSHVLLAPSLTALLCVVLASAVAQPWPLSWVALGAGLIMSYLGGEFVARAARGGRLWADGAQLRWDDGPPVSTPPPDMPGWVMLAPTSLIWVTFVGSLVVAGLALFGPPPVDGRGTPSVTPRPPTQRLVDTATATLSPSISPTTPTLTPTLTLTPALAATSVPAQPPVVAVTVSPQPLNGWNRSNPTVSFMARGGTSTIQSVTYSATGAANIAATTTSGSTASVAINAEGTTRLSYYATNTQGTTSPVQVLTVMLDRTAPHTSAAVSPAATNGWINRSAQVSLTAVDNDGGSGVDTIFYAVDGAGCAATVRSRCTAYTAPIQISANGMHVVSFFSTDRAGNDEQPGRITVSIDTVPPRTTASAVVAPNGAAAIQLQAVDTMPGSGVDATFFQWVQCKPGPGSPTTCAPNPNLWQRYDANKPPAPQGCFVHLWIYSRDKAGNNEVANDTGQWDCVQ